MAGGALMIDQVLAEYQRHVDTHPVDRRPIAWAYHTDIWNESVGEIGVALPEARLSVAAFAALAPFMTVYTISTSWLVVDQSIKLARHLVLTRLHVGPDGMTTDTYRVGLQVADDGRMVFAAPTDFVVPDSYRESVVTAATARLLQLHADDAVTYEESINVAKGIIDRELN